MEASDFSSINSNLTAKDVLDTLSSTLQSSSPAEEAPEVSTDMPSQELPSKSLTAKNAVEFLLNGMLKTKVCRYCLNVASPLSELDQVLNVAGQGVLYKVTIREMIASFHPFKVSDDQHFPNKICNRCLDRTLSSYLFTQQCERSERALRNYFEDMFEKLEKLDPLERTKKRGRAKLKPNPNVLIAAHEKVIDYAEPLITIINIASQLSSEVGNKDTLICPKCCLKMPNLTSLLNHEKSHPTSMWYHCHLCGKSFPKRFHLRRHIMHCSHALNELQKTDFKCQDCGTVSKDYHTHLHHIEKHKFREVMDHIVTRKMDKLCAVCLNKGSKLVELEKMVCLHGGYPEMMGDRTLYNILGSTVPETSSYKYRELLVATQAKILHLIKHSKKEDLKISNIVTPPIALSKDENINSLFVFSAPNYCNKEIVNINDNEKPIDVIFKDVKKVKTNIALSEKSSDDHEKQISNTSIQQTSPENAKLDVMLPSNNDKKDLTHQAFDNSLKTSLNVMDKLNFVFSEPILNIDAEMNVVIVVENVDNITNLCKRCWVFKKAIGKTCVECTNTKNVQDSTLYVIKNKDHNKKCHSCWLFKHCKQCGFCNSNITEICNEDTPKNQEDNVNVEIESANFDSSQKNEKQCLIDPDDFKCYDIIISTEKRKDSVDSKTVAAVDLDDNPNNKSLKANKRKIIDENPNDKAKRSKWQCPICWTTNWKRELCFCCNSPRTYNKIKYNFKLTNDFFKDLNNNNDERKIDLVRPESKTDTNEIENTFEDQTVLMNEKTINLTKTISFCIDSINDKIADLDSKNDNEPAVSSINDCVNVIGNDCDAMAVDPNENVIDSQPIESLSEDMEIVEDRPEVKLDTSDAPKLESQPNCSNNQLQPQQFQFNIGNVVAVPKIPGRKILKRSRK